MITFNNIVERFEDFATSHFFIKSFSFGSPDDVDLAKFTEFPLMHLVYTGATYDSGTKTYNIEVYILDVPADKSDKVERQREVVSDAEQCAEDIIADIRMGGNIFTFAQDYEVVNATTTPLEEETKNVLSGVLLDLSVAIPYEWDACNAPIDGVSPEGGDEPSYARRGFLRMLTLDGSTDVLSVRTIKVTNGTLTDDGEGVVTLDTGGISTLDDLSDVDIISPVQGSVISYNSGSQEWRVNNGLQELLQRFKASGTGAQIYDTLNDTTKGYIDILAASATMKVNHSGLTISEASPGVMSFSVAAGTDGNEVEFEAMTIEGSDAVSTVADIIFKQGALTYWENATGKIWLRAPNAGNITVLLPSSGGTLALTTDIPSVPVDSVNGQTGVVVLDTGDIDENGNLYYTEARVAANSAVAANTAKVGVIAGGTTGQALVKASGTNYDTEWADIAIDTQYHDRFQTDAETFRSGATATVELYYTAKADGDGLAESASSDTPGTDKIIRRKIYYSEAAFADPDTGTWVEFTPAPADDASFATVKAALLEYLKARTGGTVPISLKQTWEEVDEASLLLDTYTGASAAYSLRKLRTLYTGSAVRVRRASDNTEQDIGFTAGELDTTSLASFCGSSDGFVKVWYCQSGNSNDAEQTTTGNQPKIYDGSTGVVTENGKPAVEFDGASTYLRNSNLTTSGAHTIFTVDQYIDEDNENVLYDSDTSPQSIAFVNGSDQWNISYGNNFNTLHNANSSQNLHGFFIDGASSEFYENGVSVATGNVGTNNMSGVTIGATRAAAVPWRGMIQEFLIYDSDQSSNRTGIETNLNTFYSIYS